MAASSDVLQLKVTLKYIKPPIWRRIQVPRHYTFRELHPVIIQAMGWNNTHLHKFVARGLDIGESHPDDAFFDFGNESLDEATVKISDFLRVPKDKVEYHYDFGDGWEHTIAFEKILPASPDTQYPVCIAGKRACPPEDVGGIDGYYNHLAILADSNHEEYEETKEWLNGIGIPDWNAERFDPKEVEFDQFLM